MSQMLTSGPEVTRNRIENTISRPYCSHPHRSVQPLEADKADLFHALNRAPSEPNKSPSQEPLRERLFHDSTN